MRVRGQASSNFFFLHSQAPRGLVNSSYLYLSAVKPIQVSTSRTIATAVFASIPPSSLTAPNTMPKAILLKQYIPPILLRQNRSSEKASIETRKTTAMILKPVFCEAGASAHDSLKRLMKEQQVNPMKEVYTQKRRKQLTERVWSTSIELYPTRLHLESPCLILLTAQAFMIMMAIPNTPITTMSISRIDHPLRRILLSTNNKQWALLGTLYKYPSSNHEVLLVTKRGWDSISRKVLQAKPQVKLQELKADQLAQRLVDGRIRQTTAKIMKRLSVLQLICLERKITVTIMVRMTQALPYMQRLYVSSQMMSIADLLLESKPQTELPGQTG